MWGCVGLVEEFEDVGFVDGWLWGWDALDSEGCVEGAPGLDQTSKSVVWG